MDGWHRTSSERKALKTTEQFFSLTPDRILGGLEAVLCEKGGLFEGQRATGRVLTLNSLENRVYEVELDDVSVVAKFYRPGRWDLATISEEHQFLAELVAAEVPAVAPLRLLGGDAQTLATLQPEGIHFAVFPKIRGRIRDELQDEDLRKLGRFVGRLHAVGAARPAQHRLRLNAVNFGEAPLGELSRCSHLGEPFRSRYLAIAAAVIERAKTLLKPLETTAGRIHGDCHLGNVLWTAQGDPFFIDLDDFVTGPAVQDIWMVVRGRDEQAIKDRDQLLAGYEIFRPFDRAALGAIEVLRGLRIIHYAAWIAKRWDDPVFPFTFPQYGSTAYWQSEIEALSEILEA